MNHTQYLVAIANLFRDLNERGIRYCHWKSNCNLDRSLRGLTDLDLLIHRSHGERFRLILHQHEIKPVLSPPAKRYPAIEDYLGFDPDTGQLFHLHVHYQLILGEQFVKNYRLPLEQAFLDSTHTYRELVKVPTPELELVVLTIRALLKYRDRDVVKDILSIRSPGLPPAILREFETLLARTSLGRVSGTLEAQVDFVSPDIVLQCLTTVAEAPRSGYKLYRLRQRLRRELAPTQRHSRWWAARRYLGNLLRQRPSPKHPHLSKKTLASGGITIAVIGADGAGKSAVANELRQWLSWKLNVRSYYMGSQEPSLTSRSLYLGFRIARKMRRLWTGLAGEKLAPSRALHWLQQLLRNLHHISIGRDRYLRYLAGRQQASQGTIVIYDRYPLEAIHRVMESRPMDGPQIAAEAGNEMDRLTRVLARIEQGLYRSIRPPDYLFALHVSPHVSRQRKPDHHRETVEVKSQALRRMDRQGLCVAEIDADQPFESVVRQVKAALWDLF